MTFSSPLRLEKGVALCAGSNGVATTAKAKQEESEAKPGTPRAIEARLSSGGTTSLAATSSFDWAKIRVHSLA